MVANRVAGVAWWVGVLLLCNSVARCVGKCSCAGAGGAAGSFCHQSEYNCNNKCGGNGNKWVNWKCDTPVVLLPPVECTADQYRSLVQKKCVRKIKCGVGERFVPLS